MSEREMYYMYAKSIYEKLKLLVNGSVRYRIHKDIGAIIFTVLFKEFHFEYVITDVPTRLSHGDQDRVVDSMMRAYRGAVLKGFFKTEGRQHEKTNTQLSGSWGISSIPYND